MSSPIISDNHPSHLEPPLQESGFLLGKVVTKIHTTASYVISSIGSVAQSILSNFISVGTLGRYTLDDLKGCFPIKNSLENSDGNSKINKDLAQPELNKHDSLMSIGRKDEPNSALKEAKTRLNRHGSLTSVSSGTLRKIRSDSNDNNSQYPLLYPKLGEMVKLSTHVKTPKERLAEMEKSAINGGKLKI